MSLAAAFHEAQRPLAAERQARSSVKPRSISNLRPAPFAPQSVPQLATDQPSTRRTYDGLC